MYVLPRVADSSAANLFQPDDYSSDKIEFLFL